MTKIEVFTAPGCGACILTIRNIVEPLNGIEKVKEGLLLSNPKCLLC